MSLRTLPLALAIVITGAALTLAVPGGSAFGWCSTYLDNGPADCGGYALCIGYRWDSNGFWCQYPVPDPNPCDRMVCASSSMTTSFCTGATSQSCPYMLCLGPHYDVYGRVAWCNTEIYWPCQYCVPLGPIEGDPLSALP